MEPRNCVREGDNVIILFNDRKYYFLNAIAGSKEIFIGKAPLLVNKLIGLSFGETYHVHNNSFKRAPSTNPYSENSSSAIMEQNLTDNSQLIDNNTSQKLSQSDILNLRKQGVSGEEVVQAIINNSATFQTKTEYAKEKYIKKKQKKHVTIIKIIKPTARSLIEAYSFQGAFKICLAQLLSLSNVRAGCKSLIVESCQGLVLGAVAERMGGIGHILNGCVNSHTAIPIFNLFDFPKSVHQTVISFQLSMVAEVIKQLSSGGISNEEISSINSNTDSIKDETDSSVADLMDITTTAESGAIPDKEEDKNSALGLIPTDPQDPLGESSSPPKVKTNKFAIQLREVLNVLKSGLADNLIIVAKYSPRNLLIGLLPLLGLGRPFVVFSPYIQPLAECHHFLHDKGLATHLALTETWMRVHQVLPNRTHPNMNMDGASGYLLSGIRVESGPQAQQEEHTRDNKRPRTETNETSNVQQPTEEQ